MMVKNDVAVLIDNVGVRGDNDFLGTCNGIFLCVTVITDAKTICFCFLI